MNIRSAAILACLSLLTVTSCTYTFYPSGCDYPVTNRMVKETVMSDSMDETSGLALHDSVFFTINDSGGEAALYSFTTDVPLLATLPVPGAENADWEDLAFDGKNFYIADVGNNFGRRDTLVIYKVPVGNAGNAIHRSNSGIQHGSADPGIHSAFADAGIQHGSAGPGIHPTFADSGIQHGSADGPSVPVQPGNDLPEHSSESLQQGSPELQRITFSYDEPTFRNRGGWYSHDCEAIFWYNDSLYLFSKDWVNFTTRVYILPDEPGHYTIRSSHTYQVNALVTAADIHPPSKEVLLVGYRRFMPVVIRYSYDTDPGMISCGGKARTFPRFTGTQVEGACFDAEGNIYISSEKTAFKQALYRAY